MGRSRATGAGDSDRYRALSRFTDPKDLSPMLDVLPVDVDGICEVAKQQTIHHNLLGHHGISIDEQKAMAKVWPPRMRELLKALSEREPYSLRGSRSTRQRIIGACILESHLLAGMLRHRKIPARVRAGYFKNIQTDPSFIVKFWEQALHARGVGENLFKEDSDRWKREVDEFTRKQIAADHRIEHWACEYWDSKRQAWRLLDANNDFLKAHSNLDVPFQLPRKYFEYAFEAWEKMRSDPHFNPAQYAEEPQDGRSHIRSQMLSDSFSLLNHDIVGVSELSPEAGVFIKGRKYDELSAEELEELDSLARLLLSEPDADELASFHPLPNMPAYKAAQDDPYSFLYPE